MRVYERYKPSGIEWLGAIPAHWEVKRLAAIGLFSKGGNISRSNLLFTGKGVPAILYGDLYTKYDVVVDAPVNRISIETAEQAVRLYKGDLLFAGSGETREDIGKCVLFNGDGPAFAGGDIIILRQTEADSHFVSFSQKSWAAHFQKAASSKGEIVVHTYGSSLKNVVMPYPPNGEQVAIANYLDTETARIDEFVEKKKRLIELLKEERVAIINQAVTRGLDLNVKLKPSGIEWLGEIPKHWEIKRLRFVASRVLTGSTPSSSREDYYARDVNWFTPADFSDEMSLSDSKRKISNSSISEGVAKLFPKYSVLLVGIGATVGKVGYIEEAASSNQQVNALTMETLEQGKFYSHFLLAKQTTVFSYANVATLPILNQSQVKDIPAVVPPPTELTEIVAFIEGKSNDTAATIAKVQREIDVLNEYRTALISEVVTGKIKVI